MKILIKNYSQILISLIWLSVIIMQVAKENIDFIALSIVSILFIFSTTLLVFYLYDDYKQSKEEDD